MATFEKAEHSAAETLALSGHVANRDHAKAVASAADQKWFSMAEEDADLAKDLAAEEETRQIAYASADAAWINAEAAAGVAATAVAATANYNYQTGAIGAGVTYVSATAPLVTQAQQQFNAAFHQAYVTATGNDPGQSAVSSAWQQYADNMAANYQSLLTQAMTAWQAAGNAEAQAAQMLQNNIAGESIPRASSLAGAWTTYVGAVAPAATTLANNLADAGKALVQTLSSHAKNADHQDADNNKALADADAAAGKQLADDQTDAGNNFLQSAKDAEKPHNQALINEARDADQQANGEVTQTANGVVDEKENLARDENNESRNAAMQLVPAEASLWQSKAQLEAASYVRMASEEHALTISAPLTGYHTPTWVTRWHSPSLYNPLTVGFPAEGTLAVQPWDRVLNNVRGTTMTPASTLFNGAPGFNGSLYYVNANDIHGRIISTDQIRRNILLAVRNGDITIERYQAWTTAAEGEILIHGDAPASSVYTRRGVLLEQTLRYGARAVTVYAVYNTAHNEIAAYTRSVELDSNLPLAAQTVREAGAWGGSFAGAWAGAKIGALLGIETGPGAIGFAIVGAVAGSYAGSGLAAPLASEIESPLSRLSNTSAPSYNGIMREIYLPAGQ